MIQTPKGILLIQRNKQDRFAPELWEFPGGKADLGVLKKDLRREVAEETGLKGVSFGNLKVLHSTVEDGSLDKYIGAKIITLYIYGTKQQKYKVKLSSEHQNYKWVKTWDDISNMQIRDGVTEVLQKILGNKNTGDLKHD